MSSSICNNNKDDDNDHNKDGAMTQISPSRSLHGEKSRTHPSVVPLTSL